jgi:hypothetical protein
LLLLSNQRRIIVSFSQFRPGKNDFAFAILMSVVFAGIVGAVAGTVQLVAGPIDVGPANTEETTVALRGPGDPLDPVAPSGARK